MTQPDHTKVDEEFDCINAAVETNLVEELPAQVEEEPSLSELGEDTSADDYESLGETGAETESVDVEPISVEVDAYAAAGEEINQSAVSKSLELAAAIGSLREELKGGFSAIVGVLNARLDANEVREEMLNRLHAELQESRRGLDLMMLRPMFNALIAHYDLLSGDAESNPELSFYVEEIVEILSRNGVELYESSEDVVDRKRQRVVKTEPTTEPPLDGRISKRTRKGFAYGENVLRPEWVVTWKLATNES